MAGPYRPQVSGVAYEDVDWIVPPRSGRVGYGQTTEGSVRWNRWVRRPILTKDKHHG